MQKNLLDTLSAQHVAMLATITEVEKMSLESLPPFVAMSAKLKDFGRLLATHMHLENNFVYKDIFAKQHNDLASALSARSFLEEMSAIQKGAMLFLKTYNNPEKIHADLKNFRIKLTKIDNILTARIKLEEEGLFKFVN